jgi:hypothetical protein
MLATEMGFLYSFVNSTLRVFTPCNFAILIKLYFTKCDETLENLFEIVEQHINTLLFLSLLLYLVFPFPLPLSVMMISASTAVRYDDLCLYCYPL